MATLPDTPPPRVPELRGMKDVRAQVQELITYQRALTVWLQQQLQALRTAVNHLTGP